MKTEIIASWKLVVTKTGERYIITTASGAEVWCNKAQFDTNAETITYSMMKKGDKYGVDDAGADKLLKADRNEFKGCGKQIVKKYSSLEILDHLNAKGIIPSFQLS